MSFLHPLRAARFAALCLIAPLASLAAPHAARAQSVGYVVRNVTASSQGIGVLYDNGTNVGVGTTAPNASALLDVESTTQGFLPPQMTTTQRNAISSPATGLAIYNTTTTELETYDGATNGWEAVGAYASDAAGSTGQVQFNNGGDLGASANFFWDNTNSRLGIGTSTAPVNKLDVYGGVAIGTNYAGVSTAPTNGAIIQGNVGIGTTTPGGLLETYDSAAKTTTYTGVLHDVLDTSSTASINKIGMDIESTGTWNGTSAVNTGLIVNAAGGTTNYAATFSGGNVGIGTTNPAAVLSVNAATSYGTDSSYAVQAVDSSNTLKHIEIGYDDSLDAGVVASSYTGVGWKNTLINPTGGNVGIGTASPATNLEVYGTGAAPSLSSDTGEFKVSGTSTQELAFGEYTAGPFAFWMQTKKANNNGTAWPLVLNPLGGNVGINTTAPQVSLDVTGSIAAGTVGTEDELNLTRLLNSGVSYPQIASFQVGTYNVAYPGPYTRLDIDLKAAANGTLTADKTVMTLQSNGSVGIGTTAPVATLDVNGFARLALNSSAPATCSSTNEGAIALTHLAQVCVCDTTPAWHVLNTGTACSW